MKSFLTEGADGRITIGVLLTQLSQQVPKRHSGLGLSSSFLLASPLERAAHWPTGFFPKNSKEQQFWRRLAGQENQKQT